MHVAIDLRIHIPAVRWKKCNKSVCNDLARGPPEDLLRLAIAIILHVIDKTKTHNQKLRLKEQCVHDARWKAA